MKSFFTTIFSSVLFFFHSVYGQSTTLMDYKLISEVKAQQGLFDQEIKASQRRADQYLNMKPVSVMDKEVTPPSGDKHDYMSQGPYWWPDPDQPDGLPYIRRDGERNPEIKKISDHDYLYELIDAVDRLGLAYFYTVEEKYARKASELLRVWFIDPATRMNPNLNYGQGIPGRTEGRGIGIIETRQFCYLVDAVTLLEPSEAWTAQFHQEFKSWIGEYLTWLVESPHGLDESVHGNNHTTWYYVQTISMALFVDRQDLAHMLQEKGLPLIMDAQLESDGKQPKELARTRSYDYSSMNLMAINYFAILSEKLGQPIWDYRDQIIRKALDFLMPYLNLEKNWTYQQITEYKPAERIMPVVKIAANQYENGIYDSVFSKYYQIDKDELLLMLRYP